MTLNLTQARQAIKESSFPDCYKHGATGVCMEMRLMEICFNRVEDASAFLESAVALFNKERQKPNESN